MSNEEQTAEDKRKVVISPEDCRAALEFWKHFDIPVPEGLKKAFDTFCTDPTFENQEEVKYFVTTAISSSDHQAFKDEMFSKVREECAQVSYDMAFNRELEETLTTEEVR